MVVRDRGDDELVRAGGVAQPLKLVGHLAGRPDELGVEPVGDQLPVLRRPLVRPRLRGGRELDRPLPGPDAPHPQAVAGREFPSSAATTTSADTLTCGRSSSADGRNAAR
jgi:hypothetical protein